MNTVNIPQRLVIIDPHTNGHHPAYVRRIAEGALAHNIHCLIVCGVSPSSVPDYKPFVAQAPESLSWHIAPFNLDDNNSDDKLSLVFRQLAFYRYLKKIAANIINPKTDLVILPYIDDCCYSISILGSPFGTTPFAGISMRAVFHHPEMGLLGTTSSLMSNAKRLLYERLLKNPNLRHVFFIDETILMWLSSRREINKRTSFLPDPSDPPLPVDRDTARHNFGIHYSDTIILIYGAISTRKGFKYLLSTLAVPSLAIGVRALIVGQFDATCRELLANWLSEDITRRSRVILVDQYVDSQTERFAINASDMVWLAYENHLCMSGVMVQAAMYKKPILGRDVGLIGWYIKNREIGITLPDEDYAHAACVIEQFAADTAERNRLGRNAQVAFAKNTTATFTKILFEKFGAFKVTMNSTDNEIYVL